MKKFNVTVNGSKYEVEVEEISNSGTASAAPVAEPVAVPVQTRPAPVLNQKEAAPVASAAGNAVGVKLEAPMPGTVLNINVKIGDAVKKGDTVLMLEAMKMENEISAPADGVIVSIHVSQGASVNTGDILVTLN